LALANLPANNQQPQSQAIPARAGIRRLPQRETPLHAIPARSVARPQCCEGPVRGAPQDLRMTRPASPIRVGLIGYGYAGKTFHVPLIRSTPG